MTLNMVRLEVKLPQLMTYGHLCRIGMDTGYLLHAALRGIFGEKGPQPFFYSESPLSAQKEAGAVSGERSQSPFVLGYTTNSEQTLRDCLAVVSGSDEKQQCLSQIFSFSAHGPSVKAMPEHWQKGARYRFGLFFAPVERHHEPGKNANSRKNVVESDVWMAESSRRWKKAVADGVFTGSEKDWRFQHQGQRENVYKAWLSQYLARNGAELAIRSSFDDLGDSTDWDCIFRDYRTIAPVTRGGAGHSGAPTRSSKRSFPELSVTGTLTVTDSDTFARLLAHGVGRHCAFGYGMLLLSSAD